MRRGLAYLTLSFLLVLGASACDGGSGAAARASGADRAAAASVAGGRTSLLDSLAPGSRGTILPGTQCPVFPANNVWNTPITSLPVDRHSAAWLASMDAGSTFLHPDYGPSGDPTQPYGIPYVVVSRSQPFVHVSFDYADQSDPGPYPFGTDTPIEGGRASGGDRHAIMVDPRTCTLYELYDAYYHPGGGSTAGSGAIWPLESNALRPAGWTSADAAGLPILAGLVNYDEVASGSMDHAIRFTADCTDDTYLWPARHEAGQDDPSCPPMGARFRLERSFSLPASECSAMCQTVITTMKTYGLILADNGSNWFFQGTADARWTYTEVDQLKQIPASAFQAVDESSLMVNPNSGETSIGPPSSAVSAVAASAGGDGYLLASADGTVRAFGDAKYYGDLAGRHLNGSIISIAVDPATGGYWLLGSDGGVFAFHAPFFGSTGALHLNAPAVSLAAVPGGDGYRFVAADGGVFDFGHGATFYGSEGAARLRAPIVGIADDLRTGGYWLVGADGGIFAFRAPFLGSTGAKNLTRPIVQMEALASGAGYRFVAADGGVFDFGSAHYEGSLGGKRLSSPVVGMAAEPSGQGYWVVQADGVVSPFGGAPSFGDA